MKHRGSKPQAPKLPTPPRLPPSAPSGQEAIRQLAVQTRIDLWWLGKGTADRFYTATVVEVEITPDGAKVHLDYDDGKVRPGFHATLLAATVDEVDEPTADLTYPQRMRAGGTRNSVLLDDSQLAQIK